MKKLMMIILLAISIPTSAVAGNVKPVKNVYLMEWLTKNLIYPEEAVKNHEKGIVHVSFTISETGNTENIKIVIGISEALNSEAVKAVKNMPLRHLYKQSLPNKSFVLPVKFSIK